MRIANGAVRIDGRLDEAIWRDVPAVTDFTQKEPIEGAAPSDRTEIRFAYDDTALIIGARMYSTSPIQAPMGRRDPGDEAEYVRVSLDTYFDRRTAMSFGVSASGVRLDSYYSSDNEFDDDEGFDPVWLARTSVDEQGWVAELWIPFSQLRFNDVRPQVWGLNIERNIPSRNEEIYWEMVPSTEEGWASQFGDLHGIDGIRPSRRLELLPYVSGSSKLIGERDLDDPFLTRGNFTGGIGFDMKAGLGPNLTLEATVNPDFGQVEADPAEVNLSAFETFFDERRPFFLEGNQLLSGEQETYFYSRRIGAAPQGRASGDFVDFPATSTILSAAKLTGRLASGTSLGMLGALTAGEHARTFNRPSEFGRVRVAPGAAYGVGRIQQEFGVPGSGAGLMATVAHRDLDVADPLAALLARNAFTVNGDSTIRFREGEYELGMNAGMSYVAGEAVALDRLQRTSARYFQRPDASYVRYDPSRTSMVGGTAGVDIERRNGRHWLWEADAEVISPEFETNDLGRLSQADEISTSAQIEYRETVPGRWYRDYSFTLRSGNNQWNYAGDRQGGSLEFDMSIEWPNFWETTLDTTYNVRAQDLRLTRGGPSMETPANWQLSFSAENSMSSLTGIELNADYNWDEDGGLTFELDGEVSMRPGSQWQLTISPSYERSVETQQFVTTLAGGPAVTYGNRYIFAGIDRSTYTTELRLNYTFKPDLTLDVYAEPFSASGRYSGFGELAAPRTRLLRRYGTDGTSATTLADGSIAVTDGAARFELRNRDFNVQSFRSNVVLRWEWRPGSTLYLVWQQDRSAEITSSARATVGEMFSSPGAPGDNFFAIKTSFWFSPD